MIASAAAANAIERNHDKQFKAAANKASDIARLANDYQAQGLTRTQALQLAEQSDPQGYRPKVDLTVEQGSTLGFRPVEEEVTEDQAAAPRPS